MYLQILFRGQNAGFGILNCKEKGLADSGTNILFINGGKHYEQEAHIYVGSGTVPDDGRECVRRLR